MKDCQCASHGFCEFFKQEMTSSPPNWQWCQGATEAERLEYKKVCDIKQKRKQPTGKGSKFLTFSNLAEDCIQKLIPTLPTPLAQKTETQRVTRRLVLRCKQFMMFSLTFQQYGKPLLHHGVPSVHWSKS